MTVRHGLLNEAKPPDFPSTDLTAAAAYVLNRIPSNTIVMEAPHHRFFGKHKYTAHLCTIGAIKFVHQQQHAVQLVEKAWEGRLVHYDHSSPA